MRKLLPLLLLTACTGDNVSWETQEDNRKTARENAGLNAKQFRKDRKEFSGYRIIMRGDSTIGKNCAQGDGWASVDLQNEKGIVPLKCSTVSMNIGCMMKGDFQSRSYAAEEGSCNPNIPTILPRLEQ